jgi:hypothetical protein
MTKLEIPSCSAKEIGDSYMFFGREYRYCYVLMKKWEMFPCSQTKFEIFLCSVNGIRDLSVF